MARLYYQRNYDLYRLKSYTEIGAWTEFFELLSPVLLLFGLVFGGLFFIGVKSGASITVVLVSKFIFLTVGASLGATILMIGSKHPNKFISSLFQISPLIVIGCVLVFS